MVSYCCAGFTKTKSDTIKTGHLLYEVVWQCLASRCCYEDKAAVVEAYWEAALFGGWTLAAVGRSRPAQWHILRWPG